MTDDRDDPASTRDRAAGTPKAHSNQSIADILNSSLHSVRHGQPMQFLPAPAPPPKTKKTEKLTTETDAPKPSSSSTTQEDEDRRSTANATTSGEAVESESNRDSTKPSF